MNPPSGREFLDNLHTQYPELSQVEKKISYTIERILEKIPDMTVTELAERSEVSEASVIRFAKKIGYSGYYQMKIEIIRSLYSGNDIEKIKQSQPDDLMSIKDRAGEIAESNIRNCFKAIDIEALGKAAQLVMKAECIYFFAAGNSLNAALDASYKFGKLGFRTICETVPERSLLQARNMRPGDIAFGISRSGSSKLVTLALKIVHRKKLPVIMITNYPKSPCSAYCDIMLLTSSWNAMYPGEAVLTRLSETAVIDLVYYVLLAKRSETSQESLTESEDDQSSFSL